MGKNISDTPETQSQSANCCYCVSGEFVPADFARQLERERNMAVNQNTRLQSAMITLINLNEGLADGGVGITGEDWEIAGYALRSLENV